MNNELLQSVIDIVFKGTLLYLSPVLFFLIVILFADRLIDLFYNALGDEGSRKSRRT